jgi:hypothetical protein
MLNAAKGPRKGLVSGLVLSLAVSANNYVEQVFRLTRAVEN